MIISRTYVVYIKLYINDLPENLTHKFKLYADDRKLIIELGADRDDDDMQCDITYRKVKWYENWSNELGPEKSKVMHLGKQLNSEDYLIAGKNLSVAREIRVF